MLFSLCKTRCKCENLTQIFIKLTGISKMTQNILLSRIFGHFLGPFYFCFDWNSKKRLSVTRLISCLHFWRLWEIFDYFCAFAKISNFSKVFEIQRFHQSLILNLQQIFTENYKNLIFDEFQWKILVLKFVFVTSLAPLCLAPPDSLAPHARKLATRSLRTRRTPAKFGATQSGFEFFPCSKCKFEIPWYSVKNFRENGFDRARATRQMGSESHFEITWSQSFRFREIWSKIVDFTSRRRHRLGGFG